MRSGAELLFMSRSDCVLPSGKSPERTAFIPISVSVLYSRNPDPVRAAAGAFYLRIPFLLEGLFPGAPAGSMYLLLPRVLQIPVSVCVKWMCRRSVTAKASSAENAGTYVRKERSISESIIKQRKRKKYRRWKNEPG